MKRYKKQNRCRRVQSDSIMHIYCRSFDKGVMINSLEDHLVLFSIICVSSIKYNVIIVGISFMITHFHLLLRVQSSNLLSRYMNSVITTYVRIRNREMNRSGQLVQKRFGSAPKLSEKKCRSAIAYLYNNPVEKKLCTKAIENRWNLQIAKFFHIDVSVVNDIIGPDYLRFSR